MFSPNQMFIRNSYLNSNKPIIQLRIRNAETIGYIYTVTDKQKREMERKCSVRKSLDKPQVSSHTHIHIHIHAHNKHSHCSGVWVPALSSSPLTNSSLFQEFWATSLGRRHHFRPFHLSGALACFNSGGGEGRRLGGGAGVDTGRNSGPCPCLCVPGLHHSSFPSLLSPPLCSAKPLSRCLSAEEFCHNTRLQLSALGLRMASSGLHLITNDLSISRVFGGNCPRSSYQTPVRLRLLINKHVQYWYILNKQWTPLCVAALWLHVSADWSWAFMGK